MKLRITKGRVACVVVLAPVLYVLNCGPLIYAARHSWLNYWWAFDLTYPVDLLFANTPLERPYKGYIEWWKSLP
jgi:hypothetical protein